MTELVEPTNFCGCCGRPTEDDDALWCLDCETHVLDLDRSLADATFFAQFGVDCPHQVGT